jgi:photosynthetic reaction center cytochrome c subunit
MLELNRIVRRVFVASVFALGLGALASSQVPDKFTNLQYFPKTIQRDDLMQVMRGFSFSLGVRCEYCHAAKDSDPPEKKDFASDEKEAKKTARAMLRMLDAINQDYVAKLSSQTQNRVHCVTCHHGLSKPKGIAPTLAETLESKGIPDAIGQYKDLRKRYYGGAQYDFSETPLNQLAETLNRSGKAKEAVAIMEMNAELNAPLSGWGDSVLAMAHVANQDVDKAKADFQRILVRTPDNPWAKKQLDELNQKPQ